jgi:type II secretory pathway pseudopilin PulG
MRTKLKQSGLTLPELAVVIATMALLVGFALPALRALLNSFETQSGATTLISTALASARAMAAKEQRYAGVRFQEVPDLKGPLKASQYMVFIIQDPSIMAYGFRAIDGVKPIKLPDNVSVMDLTVLVSRNLRNPVNPQEEFRIDDPLLEPLLTDPQREAARNALIDEPREVIDVTTFSIIFSPSGKLAIHGVRVRNRDGRTDDTSNDDVFNTKNNVDAGIGMFYQDDYFSTAWTDLSLGPEPSRNSFVIIDEMDKFEQAYGSGRAWSDYLAQKALDRIYINSYTGTMILQD